MRTVVSRAVASTVHVYRRKDESVEVYVQDVYDMEDDGEFRDIRVLTDPETAKRMIDGEVSVEVVVEDGDGS